MEGIEPPPLVLETSILPLNYTPISPCLIPSNAKRLARVPQRESTDSRSSRQLLRFLVVRVRLADRTVLLHFQAILVDLLVLMREVIHGLALRTLKLDQIVLRHTSLADFR